MLTNKIIFNSILSLTLFLLLSSQIIGQEKAIFPEGRISASNIITFSNRIILLDDPSHTGYNGRIRIYDLSGVQCGESITAEGGISDSRIITFSDRIIVLDDPSHTGYNGRIRIYDLSGRNTITKVIDYNTPSNIEKYALSQNYPNPFNESTQIEYQLQVDSKVQITIFNELGQMVRTLIDKEQPAGKHSIQWDGLNDNGFSVSSGIYFYNIQSSTPTSKKFIETKKMIVLK